MVGETNKKSIHKDHIIKMSRKGIHNIETLNLEISRLKSEINSQEQEIQLQVTEFKNHLNPVNLLGC